MDDAWMISLEDAQARLPDDPDVFRFWYGLRRGTMKVGLYAPKGEDRQGPHKQDELYIVIRGSGDFIKGEERRRFAAHDVLFVEAGMMHRFENFSADFATWVVFWGPLGGEGETCDRAEPTT
ncbi:cupin domain-containing protein [Lichenicoccus sp.]|uniref:cupin domain-containing protein n=1 Tax=Lichenicoccus sp. TaxID=2781899 RepID=UPI003D10708A